MRDDDKYLIIVLLWIILACVVNNPILGIIAGIISIIYNFAFFAASRKGQEKDKNYEEK